MRPKGEPGRRAAFRPQDEVPSSTSAAATVVATEDEDEVPSSGRTGAAVLVLVLVLAALGGAAAAECGSTAGGGGGAAAAVGRVHADLLVLQRHGRWRRPRRPRGLSEERERRRGERTRRVEDGRRRESEIQRNKTSATVCETLSSTVHVRALRATARARRMLLARAARAASPPPIARARTPVRQGHCQTATAMMMNQPDWTNGSS